MNGVSMRLYAIMTLVNISTLQAMQNSHSVASPTSITAAETTDATDTKKLTINTFCCQTKKDHATELIKAILTPETPAEKLDILFAELAQMYNDVAGDASPDTTEQYALDEYIGLTPLQQAVRNNNETQARILLEQGADPDIPAALFCFTARQMAANEPETPTSRLVLSWPSSPTKK